MLALAGDYKLDGQRPSLAGLSCGPSRRLCQQHVPLEQRTHEEVGALILSC